MWRNRRTLAQFLLISYIHVSKWCQTQSFLFNFGPWLGSLSVHRQRESWNSKWQTESLTLCTRHEGFYGYSGRRIYFDIRRTRISMFNCISMNRPCLHLKEKYSKETNKFYWANRALRIPDFVKLLFKTSIKMLNVH